MVLKDRKEIIVSLLIIEEEYFILYIFLNGIYKTSFQKEWSVERRPLSRDWSMDKTKSRPNRFTVQRRKE